VDILGKQQPGGLAAQDLLHDQRCRNSQALTPRKI